MPVSSGFSVKRRAALEAGAIVFRQGERFTAVHIVAAGCLKLSEANEEGVEHIVALRLPGDLVGIEAWARGHYPYTAEVVAPTRLCQLQWPHLKDRAPTAALLERMLRKTAVQLEQSTRVWANLPAIERVAAFLDHFARRAGPSSDLPITRAEIGSLLGLAEETVVRAITRLRAQQRLQIKGRRLVRTGREPPQSGT